MTPVLSQGDSSGLLFGMPRSGSGSSPSYPAASLAAVRVLDRLFMPTIIVSLRIGRVKSRPLCVGSVDDLVAMKQRPQATSNSSARTRGVGRFDRCDDPCYGGLCTVELQIFSSIGAID